MTDFILDQNAVLVGVIIAPHAIAGACSAECLSDNPRRFVAGAKFFDEHGKTHTLTKASFHKGRLLLSFEGVQSRDEAEKLRGTKLYINAADSAPLPEDEFYDYQLVGLSVRDSGEIIGKIEDILHYTANDVFVVRGDDKKEILIPALKVIVKNVDIAAATMDVELPLGLR